jgi:hypothetical protein
VTPGAILHLVAHAAVPGLIAWLAFRPRWERAWAIMLTTMLVDLDHLVADPIYDPNRCSIGFHPLHTYPAVVGYILLALWARTRLVGIGLVIHMALDALDCL